MQNNIKIIKVNPQNILPINEAWAATAGFSTSPDYGNPAFSYEIKPLSFTLCQKGNDPEMLNKNKSFKFFVGDHVSGYCPYDGKKHEGMIKYFYWVPGSDGTMPKFVYIQDFSNEDTIPLEADSIKQTLTRYTPNDLAVKDYYRARDTEIAHDYGASEIPKNVFEGKNFDFNNVLIENNILKEYGLEYIFELNEDNNSNVFQKFIDPFKKALTKIKSKFGEETCKNIANIVKQAKTKGKTSLYVILTLITLACGTLNANAEVSFLGQASLLGRHSTEIGYNIAQNLQLNGKDYIEFKNNYINDFENTLKKLDNDTSRKYEYFGIGTASTYEEAYNIAVNDLKEGCQYHNKKVYYDTVVKAKYVQNGKTCYLVVIGGFNHNIPPIPENFNFNGKTLNEQYAYLNEDRVMAKKFFEDNFDLKPAKGFSFKQYVDKSTGAYVTTEPFDGKPTGTMKFFAKHGISKVYNGSIGFSEKEQKWYGWSHRAIYGFGIGSKVKKGDCGYKGKTWTAKTLDDAKQMAKDFVDAVS